MNESEMSPSSNESLDQVFKEFWDWRLKESPEFATQIGIHDYDDKLDSYDLAEIQKRTKKCEGFLKRARELEEKSDNYSDEEKFNLQVFIEELTTFVGGMRFEGYLFPINYIEGIHLDFERLIGWMVYENETDYQKLCSRYKHFPIQVDEIIALLERGLDQKMTNHAVSMNGVIEQIASIQVAPKNSPFYKPFEKISPKIPADIQEKLRNQGLELVKNYVLPAFEKLENFLSKEYIGGLRPEIACTSLPNGKEFYQQCLNFHLSIQMKPQEVHDIGLKEVDRIETEMKTIMSKMNFKGSLKEFIEKLRTDKQNYCSTKEELLSKFKDLAENKIGPLIPKIIKNIPKMKMQIKSYPSNSPNAPAAYYLAGSHDGSRPGCFYVNLEQYACQPLYELISLSLHEGQPGHHTQCSYQIEQNGLPMFRRFMEDRKYSDSPSRFPIYTSYGEGWGLYSETLGEDLGLYNDPMAKFGHCSEEIFRACRLVVDTGMHALGWTHQQAVEYMKNHSAASVENIKNEINRYITWPGQACAYKIGELKLKELRKKAEETLGDKFDLREFHEILLKYGGPLHLLEQRVDVFIEQSK